MCVSVKEKNSCLQMCDKVLDFLVAIRKSVHVRKNGILYQAHNYDGSTGGSGKRNVAGDGDGKFSGVEIIKRHKR